MTAITSGPWPKTEADRRRLFERLGLREGTQIDPDQEIEGDQSQSPHGSATTSLEGIAEIIWDTPGGKFSGIDFFAYASEVPDRSRRGYGALHDLLSSAYGPPGEEWGDVVAPASRWLVNGIHVEMYCHAQRDSVVQVGVENAELVGTERR